MRTSSLLAQLKGDTSWMHHLTDAAIAQLESAVAHVKAKGLNFPHFVKDDFPLADDVLDLKLHSEELENGRGFFVLRGLPVERYSEEDIHIMYYGIGLHMGIPVRQNPRGDLLGLVMNVGDATQKTTRVYETNLYLPYHSDPSDVVGLLCIRKAKQGGLSSLVSVAASTTKFCKIIRSIWGCITGLGTSLICVKTCPVCRPFSATIKASSVAAICASTLNWGTRCATCHFPKWRSKRWICLMKSCTERSSA